MPRSNPPAPPSRAPRHTTRRAATAAPTAALALAAGLAAALTACVSRAPSTTASGSAAAPADSARAATADAGTIVTLHREGGFAGLVTDATVDGVARRYQTVTRHMCGAEGANCPPPIDSAAGPLPDSLVAVVARAVDAADFYALRPDYGTDPKLRDGYLYAVTVRRGDRTATVRGDDVTRPPALATLTSEMQRAIEIARGRR
jgi:hypothetical protein